MQSTLCEISDLKYARKIFELSTLLHDNCFIRSDIKCISEKHEGLGKRKTRLTQYEKFAEGIEHTATAYTKINNED